MTCPYCGSEMKNGYLQSSRVIVWSSEILYFTIVPKGGGDFRASKEAGVWGAHNLRSNFCEECNILISIPLKE